MAWCPRHIPPWKPSSRWLWVKVGLAFARFDDLGDLAGPDSRPQRGDKAPGFRWMHYFPCGVGGLAVGRVRLAAPRWPVTKRRAEKISPQSAEQGNELVSPRFVAPRSDGERLNDLASEPEFDRPELPAGAGDVESHVHGVVQ